MRLTLLGATGRTGRVFVPAALDRGHDIRVLAPSRAAAEVHLPADRLSIHVGAAVDGRAIDAVVDGADAVVDLLEPSAETPDDVRAVATRSVLGAMHVHVMRRLVMVTGAGVRTSADEPALADRVLLWVSWLLQGRVLRDEVHAVAEVRARDLDWTIARVPQLVDSAARGYRVSPRVDKDSGSRLARADLAAFVLDELGEPRFVRRCPVVTW